MVQYNHLSGEMSFYTFFAFYEEKKITFTMTSEKYRDQELDLVQPDHGGGGPVSRNNQGEGRLTNIRLSRLGVVFSS